MTEKELILKDIEEAEAKLKDARNRLDNYKPVEYYEVHGYTPISGAGNIIFNGRLQVLKYTPCCSTWCVCLDQKGFINLSDEFVWVPIKREDLKPGDVAYRTDGIPSDDEFKYKGGVCLILSSKKYTYIKNEENVNTSSLTFNYWYKLTPREEVE